MEKELLIHQPVSHACIHDCSRCHHTDFPRDAFFEGFVRKLIRFPADGRVDCRHTKVDLSCMFGGADFASGEPSKKRPTLVSLQHKHDLPSE
ncbi:MAG: hypothetical protein ACOX5R_17600 [bacterium]|jgi:hypothetical protein